MSEPNYMNLARQLAEAKRDGFLEWHGISAESADLVRGLDEVHNLLQIGLETESKPAIPLEQAWQNWRAQ